MKILFFGRLSDEIGCREWLYEPAETHISFDDLLIAMQDALGDNVASFLTLPDVTVAVDQVIVDTDKASIASASEVAFFPPVTGG